MQLQDIAFRPAATHTAHFPASNTAAVAQVAAVTGKTHYIRGVTVSCNGTPAAAILVTVTSDVGGTPTVLDKFYIPAAAFAPVLHNYTVPLKGTLSKTVEVTVAAPGAGISVGAVLRTFVGD